MRKLQAAQKVFAALIALLFSFGLRDEARAAYTPSVVGVDATSYGVSVTNADNTTAIQNAINATGSGQLNFPCGSFSFSGTITLTTGRPLITGLSSTCTVLNYTGSGTAIIWSYAPVGNSNGHGLSNLTLHGPGRGGSTIGLQLGSSSGAATSAAQFFTGRDVQITGFGTGLIWANASWLSSFDTSLFYNNGININFPSGLNFAGEEMNFTDTTFASNVVGTTGCVTIAGFALNINFKGGSFDNCPVLVSPATNASVVFYGTHFESPASAPNRAFITNGGAHISLSGVNVVLDSDMPAGTGIFSGSAGNYNVLDLFVYQGDGNQIPAIFTLSGTASLFESSTHPVQDINSNPQSVANYVQNSGTGQVTLNTSPEVVSAAAVIYEDMFGDGNFGGYGQVNHARSNPGPTNLLQYSNAFTNGVWVTRINAPTLTANTSDVTDPFGGNAATKVVPSGSGSTGILQTGSFRKIPGAYYTATLWARTSSGTESVQMGPQDTACTLSLTIVWKRFSCTLQLAAGNPAANDNRLFQVYSAASLPAYYIYGAQTVPGQSEGVYTPTTSINWVPNSVMTQNGFSGPGPNVFGSNTDYFYNDLYGRPSWTSGSAPALSACTGGTLDSSASDASGTVVLSGAAATCTITFGHAYTSFSHCSVTFSNGAGSQEYIYTLLDITLSGTLTAGNIDYRCDGR